MQKFLYVCTVCYRSVQTIQFESFHESSNLHVVTKQAYSLYNLVRELSNVDNIRTYQTGNDRRMYKSTPGGALQYVLFTLRTHAENKKLWKLLIAYSSTIRHGLHRKRRVQELFYYCVCIHCSSDVFTEPLPNNIHIDRRALRSTPLRWAQVPWYCHISGVYVTNNNGFWISWLGLLALINTYSQL
jgi:hypothetical protein